MDVTVVAGVVAAAAAIVALIFQIFPHRAGIRIKRITRHTDPDLASALHLHKVSLLSSNTRDRPEQIVEWFEQIDGFYGERYRKYRDQVWALLPLSRINPSPERHE